MASPKTEVNIACRGVNARTGDPCPGQKAYMTVINIPNGKIVRYVCTECHYCWQINQGGAAY